MNILKLSKQSLNKVVETLQKGGVVVCPTDTVYGFLADAGNKKVVEKIYKIKKRPRSKLLPVFVKDIKMAKSLAIIGEKQEKILNKKWPGKYTFVFNAKRKSGTVAIRIPKYKFLNDLLKKVNKPLVQTSVNISDEKPLSDIKEIIKVFADENKIDLIIDSGNLPKSKPSAIIDLTKQKIKILRK